MKIPFFNKQEPNAAQPKRYSGMSKSSTPIQRMKNDTPDIKQIAAPKISDVTHINTNLLKPLQPYLSIVADDIMRIFRRDKKTIRMKQEHDDFMEHFFGGNK